MIIHFFKFSVFAGIADVGDPVDRAEAGHDGFGDSTGGDFVVEFSFEVVHGVLNENADLFAVAGAFIESQAETVDQLGGVEGFEGTVALVNVGVFCEELFEGAEALSTGGAFPASADVGSGGRGAGVDDSGFVGCALGATHGEWRVGSGGVRCSGSFGGVVCRVRMRWIRGGIGRRGWGVLCGGCP